MVDLVNAGIAGVSTLIAGLALWASNRAARDSKNAANASMLHDSLSEYSNLEMLEALRDLREFAKNEPILQDLHRLHAGSGQLDDHDLNTAKEYVRQFEPSLGSARRRVHFFYKRAWRLWKNRYLSESDLKIIAESDGFELLCKVVRPLSLAVNLVDVQDGDIKRFRQAAHKFKWYEELARVVQHDESASATWGWFLCGVFVGVALLVFWFWFFGWRQMRS